jgi:glycosyltransferase involved in cell wall biosynthesis
MTSLLQDGDLADRLRRRGLARARQLTWQACAQATAGVYAAVLAAQAGNQRRA